MAKEKTENPEQTEKSSAAPTSEGSPREASKPSKKSDLRPPKDSSPQAESHGGKKQKAGAAEKKPEKAEAPDEEKVAPRLFDLYKKEILPTLLKRFSYTNPMQAPKLEKIAINCGVGAATQDPKILETVVRDLTIVAGQKPSTRKSKKAISNFKLRENMAIGCKITLRREKMYEFMDRLITLAIPRVRDFRGVPDKSFDGRGNYTLGIKEQIIFPEIDVDKVENFRYGRNFCDYSQDR